jgi:Maf-like protein
VLDGRILEKPRSEADSYAMLKALSGRAHTVISAIALFLKGGGDAEPAVAMSVMTEVTFSDIDDELIYAYIRTGDPADKAGSYGIQSVGCQFIEKVGHFRRCVRSSRRDMSVITVMYSLPFVLYLVLFVRRCVCCAIGQWLLLQRHGLARECSRKGD